MNKKAHDEKRRDKRKRNVVWIINIIQSYKARKQEAKEGKTLLKRTI